MTSVIYGIASSAYHSIRSLRENDFERVAQALTNNFYLDDFLSGSNSLVEAEELQDRLIKTLMELRCGYASGSQIIQD